jgi:hypothetical protein
MSHDYETKRVPASGKPPVTPDGSVPNPATLADGQCVDHWILSEDERAKGFVRPVRRKYQHVKCGTVTTMGIAIAETYARDPKFYGRTFCCHCGGYFAVGADGEFVWDETEEKVGT